MAKPPANSVRHSEKPGECSGFNGELRCASLSDLIQLECLSGAREAVAVASNGRKGHLFFEGGAMVHASTGEIVGNEAAFEVVSWRTGTFSASDQPWPEQHTITIPWQQLLMQAAQRADELERGPSARRSVAPRSHTLRHESVVSQGPGERARERRSSMPLRSRPPSGTIPVVRKPVVPPPPKVPGSSVPSMAGAVGAVRRAVRLDDEHQLLAERGQVADLVELAPGLKRAIEALGAVLGLEGFRSFECALPGRRLMLYRDTRDSYIALEAAPGANLVRRFVGNDDQ